MVKRSCIVLVALSFAIMLFLPWSAVTFVKGDAGMAVCFLLFYAVDPIYSAIAGYFAGRDIRRMWSLPVICAAAFLLGTWLLFDMGERAFILYAGIYFLIGTAVMLLSAFAKKQVRP